MYADEFSVYTGKNAIDLDNTPARAVPLEEVMAAVRKVIAAAPKAARPKAVKG